MIVGIFENSFSRIENDIKNSKFPFTAKALFRFYTKLKLIKSTIDSINDSKEVYTAKILLRVLFEHLIVSYYIFEKYKQDSDDTVGNEYYHDYLSHEFFKQKGYLQKLDNIRNNLTKNINGLEYIRIKFSEFEEVEQTQYEEINRKGNQFKIDNILKYLNQETTKSEFHNYMLELLNEYNRLSSYVHGGPSAEDEAIEVGNDNTEDLVKIKAWSETSVESLMQFIMLFLSNEHFYYLEILEPWKKHVQRKI